MHANRIGSVGGQGGASGLRLRVHAWRILAVTVASLAMLTSGAYAYWKSSGEGSASAAVGTLSAPTISSATSGAESVALTWSAVTPPGAGTVEYFVTRDGGAPSGGCPSSSSPSIATSCTDTGAAVGVHEYTVTAVWRTWTATSTARSVTVTFGQASQLQLEAASITPTAAEADNLTITAKDASGNTVPTYSGSHTLVFEGPGEALSGTKPTVVDRSGVAKPLGESTEITFTEGHASVSAGKNGVLRLYRAEAAPLKVREGSLSNGAGLAMTVKAGAFKSFLVTPQVAEPEAGSSFEVKLTAADEWHNTVTSYARTNRLHYEGAESSPNGTAPEYSSTTEPVFSAGEATLTGFKLYKAASTTLKVKEEVSGHEGSATFTVKAASASSFSVPTPSEREAGVAFSVVVTAWDAWHNTAKSYTGSRTLAWSGPASSPSGQAPEYPTTASAVTFTEGVGTASGITLFDAQSTTLKATEGSLEGSTGSFMVKAAGAKKLSVPTPSEQEAGVALSVTLTALDEWDNVAKSYTGNKTITWSGPASSPGGQAPEYPSSAKTVTFAAGVGTASAIKLFDAQSTTLTAKQSTNAGSSAAFTVNATAAERLGWSQYEVTKGKFEAGTCPFACKTTNISNNKKFKAQASVTDKYGNVVSNLGAGEAAKIEKTSGEGTLTNATGLTIPTSGPAECSTIFEYTSPPSGTSEAVLKLKVETGTAYTEAEAFVKF